jgi:ABC-type lipoprotein release transport system permease subunit
MNNFRRQQLRGGFVTIITALLLVVSVAFSIIGYAASDGSKQQLEAVESRYTTIGAMTDQNTHLLKY